MMKRFLFLLTISILFSCKTENHIDISYVISHHTNDDKALLKIRMSFEAQNEGKTILLFQDKAWGQDSLYNVIASMQLLNTEGTISQNRDKNYIELNYQQGLKHIDFEYTLKQDTKGDLTTINTYRPVIEDKYFHVFSHNALMLPKDIVDTRADNFNVSISWQDFPENYALQNSFGSNQRNQFVKNTTEEKFHSAVFVGGDFRIHNIDIDNNKVVFAVRSQWNVFQDSTMVKMLKNTVSAQRDFWQDHTQDYFSVTMIPTVQERGYGFQGTGLTNSFAINATNNEYLEMEGLVYLFNHELQHNWTGHVIKNDNEEEQYWFSEGFTEYYTFKNIAANHIYGLDKNYYIRKFNETVTNLYTSPVKESPNSEINYDNFWSNRDYGKLPYYRGALFAFYLDHKIKQDSQDKFSLDNLMLEIKRDAVTKGQKVSHDYFLNLANQYLREDIEPFFQRHIIEGHLMDLAELYEEFGLEYIPKSPVFDLGFEFSEDRKNIAAIDAESEAYKAGLRVGDRLTLRSYYSGRSDFKAEFKKLERGREIPISFYPVKEVDLPQLKSNSHNFEQLTF